MEKKNEGVTFEKGNMQKPTQIQKWLRKHKLQYTAATKHPFVYSIHGGLVDFSSFKKWLELAAFAASVLLKAWKESTNSSDVEVMLAGLGYLNDEICWLKKEAPKWHISLTSVVVDHKPVLDYFRFFERLTSSEVKYAEAVTILWAVESVYHNGFGHCLEEGNNTPQEMKDACKRFGNDNFKRYCQSLENMANQRLEEVSDEEVSKTEVLIPSFLKMLFISGV